jgi:hypothetical protein
MYTENPAFIQPQNENQQVWRYMDFTKFVSLLGSGRLRENCRRLRHDRARAREVTKRGKVPVALRPCTRSLI